MENGDYVVGQKLRKTKYNRFLGPALSDIRNTNTVEITMKRLILTFTIALATLFTFCQNKPDFEKVDSSAIDSIRLHFVTKLADQILMAQKQGRFYQLGESEATNEMITGLSERAQKQAYLQVEGLYGAYRKVEFDHLMKSKSEPLYEVYRFKGHFNMKEAEVEVRAVLNAEGKLAGFFIKPWSEEL